MHIRQEVRIGAAWIGAIVVAVLLLVAAMERAAQAHLSSEAEHTALHWAQHLRDTVPDLPTAFAGQGFSPRALAELDRLRHQGEVFRFKVFARDGRQLLVSDDIVGGPDGATIRAGAASPPEPDHHVHQLVLDGQTRIEVKRGTPPRRPAVYGEAYVPVLRDGTVLGVVEVYVDQAARAERIARSFRVVAIAVAFVLLLLFGLVFWQWLLKLRQQRRSQAQVHYLAQHDPLTGAFNRAAFHEAMAQAEVRASRGGGAFAVLCIDLDRFKEINDSLGHAAGDEALRAVTRRLHGAVGPEDVVARTGGDEFAVLQPGVRQSAEVSRLAQRVVDALAEPYEIFGHRVPGGGSVGAAIQGADGHSASDLLHRADLALYRAKAQGRGQYSFYDRGTDEALQTRRAMIRDLRRALDEDGLHVHFQPMVDRDGATLSGYEALARWTRPGHGPVSPMVFVPLAEEAGLIDALGGWVLQHACREAATWPPSLDLSVNLSAAQFQGDLVSTVARCLAESGLPAQRLQLEITESLLIQNTDAVLQTLHRLTAMGVRIVMDDFGTGYSSLAYLWRFPFDKLKIDRAFTQHMETDPKVDLIVRSIVSLAHAMNIRVNAEGVETPAQLARLQQLGCDEMQGFLLGKPAAAASLDHSAAATDAPPPSPPRATTEFGGLTTLPMPLT